MATVSPGDRFQRTRKGHQRVFECRAVQTDAFHRWGGGSTVPLARHRLRAPGAAGQAGSVPQDREAGALS